MSNVVDLTPYGYKIGEKGFLGRGHFAEAHVAMYERKQGVQSQPHHYHHDLIHCVRCVLGVSILVWHRHLHFV